MKQTVASAVLLGTAITAMGSGASAYPRPSRSELISVTSNETQSDGDSGGACGGDWTTSSITPDGRYVAFSSMGDDLAAGDENKAPDIFVRDRKTGKTELVSVTPNGLMAAAKDLVSFFGQCNFGSLHPALSSSGRFVAFESRAPLVPDDELASLASPDVFLRDRQRGITELISTSTTTAERPAISADGRRIVYEGLGPLDTAGQIFLHDRKTNDEVLVSVGVDGEPADSHASAPSISGSGRFVVFTSDATNLVADVPFPMGNHVYLHDTATGKTELVSRDIDGDPADAPGTRGSVTSFGTALMSHDGRYVAYASHSDRLVPNDRRTFASYPDIVDNFVFDRKTKRTQRVTDSNGVDLAGNPENPTLSTDGRFLAFTRGVSGAIGSPTSQTCSTPCDGVSIHDLFTGSTEAVGPALDGGDPKAQFPVVSRVGRYVAFTAKDDVWHPDDRNEAWDIVLYDRGLPLGAGDMGGSPQISPPDADDRLCVADDLCIPPDVAISSSDEVDDLNGVLTEQGANLYGASLAYRPQYEDLFAAIELEHMPMVVPGASPIFYGLRFGVEDRKYEVRATSLDFGTFRLFDCTDSVTCTKIARLRGGYGTTGMRVVFSLPLDEIGLEDGGKLQDVVAFSGIGSHLSGATKVLDRVKIR